MQSSPSSCHFNPLRPKYAPQHPVLRRPQSVISLIRETECQISTKQQAKLYFLNILILTFLGSRREDKNSELHGSEHSE
jgi:hypothetical protein